MVLLNLSWPMIDSGDKAPSIFLVSWNRYTFSRSRRHLWLGPCFLHGRPTRKGINKREVEFKLFSDAFSFSPVKGVDFLPANSMILSDLSRKVGIYLKTFEASLRLPLTKFQKELLQKNGFSAQMLTLNVVNMEVAFEMICRAIFDLLKTIQFVPEENLDVLLSGVGMSPSLRHWGKMPILYTVIKGVESPFSIDHDLQKRYRGNLEHRETDLFETLPSLCWAGRLIATSTPVTLPLEGSSATVRERPSPRGQTFSMGTLLLGSSTGMRSHQDFSSRRNVS
ncbi:unnamed protein product [Lactuca saligna]|uniref:Uncharacterized protein n=1 Tax=Lactuca saligna TaxID=75948 RepID=A0AA35YZZ1_LACSI|nr:unnamed protein product [Lactuca saligna]